MSIIDGPTPIECPKPQRKERVTLSEINLQNSSIPPGAPEDDKTLEALRRVDAIGRAHASSFNNWRQSQEERHLQAEHERKISRLKAWGTFIASVIGAIGAAIAAIMAATR